MKNKRSISFLLALTFLIVQTFVFAVPTYAVGETFSVSHKVVRLSKLSETVITVGIAGGTFTENAVPYLFINNENTGASFKPGSITIAANGSSISFILMPYGLSDGDYYFKIVDGVSVYGADQSIPFRIGDPIVASSTPTSLAKGYDQQTSITINTENTNFVLGSSTVEILSGETVQTGIAGSVTSVAASGSYGQILQFSLNTGLPSGTYSVRITTGSEVVTGINLLTVRGIPTMVLSVPTVNEGYSNTDMEMTGINTKFVQNETTVSVLDGSETKSNVGTITVNSGTSLSFQLTSGLAADVSVNKTYTVKVKTGVEEATATLTVMKASAQVQGLDTISEGYSAALNASLVGANTNFTNGVTTLALYKGQTDLTTKLSSVEVAATDTITYSLNTGLVAGNDYTLVATTGSNSITAGFTVKTPTVDSLDFSGSSVVPEGTTNVPAGYSRFLAYVNGTNTLFNGSTDVKIYNGLVDTAKTATVVRISDTRLSLYIEEGLTVGTYTMKVDIDGDGDFEATKNFTVTSGAISSVTPNTFVTADTNQRTITVLATNSHFSKAIPTVKLYTLSGETKTYLNTSYTATVSNGSDIELSFNLTPSSVAAATYGVEVTVSAQNIIQEVISKDNAIKISATGIQNITPSTLYTHQLGDTTITVTGTSTTFSTQDTDVFIDDVEITSSLSIASTEISFTAPAELTEGVHTLKITQSAVDYTVDFTVKKPVLKLTNLTGTLIASNTFGYSAFDAAVKPLEGITFASNDKPILSITDANGATLGLSTENISTSLATVSQVDELRFAFPTSLPVGSYQVKLAWSSGSVNYPSYVLTLPIEVVNEINALAIKSSNSTVTTLNIAQGLQTFDLTAFGTLISGGTSVDRTTLSSWSVTSGADVLSVNDTTSKGRVTITKSGTAVVQATYNGQTAQVTVNVLAASVILQKNSIAFTTVDEGYASEQSLVFKGTNTNFTAQTQLKLYNGNPDSGGIEVTPSKIITTFVDATTLNGTLATGLTPGVYYIKDVTVGAVAVKVSFTVNQAAPVVPTGLAIGTTTKNSVQLSWSTIDNATSYKVYRATTQGGTYNQIGSSTTAAYTDSTIASGQTYWYKITAGNSIGYSTYSTEISVTTLTAKPIATNITIVGNLVEGQTLTGSYQYYDENNDPESGTTTRWVRSDEQSGTYSAIDGATTASYVFTVADQGKFIKYEVTPKNAAQTNAIGDATLSSAVGPVVASVPTLTATQSGTTTTLSIAGSITQISGQPTQVTITVKDGSNATVGSPVTVNVGNAGSITGTFTMPSEAISGSYTVTLSGTGIIPNTVGCTYTKGDGTIIGDVNGDSYVDADDISSLKRYVVGVPGATISDEQAADVNGDEFVDAEDISKLKRYVVGIPGETLP